MPQMGPEEAVLMKKSNFKNLVTLSLWTTAEKYPAGVRDTGEKYPAGVSDTGENYPTGVRDTAETSRRLLNNDCGVRDTGENYPTGVRDTGENYPTGVSDTARHFFNFHRELKASHSS